MKRKVLVIEDEPIIAEMMSILLEVEGYKVISLADTARARQKLHQKEVDMVMLDLGLKGENGQSMCAYIKGQDDLKHIPVILVSANSDLEQIKQECGADDHIAKPFDLTFFLQKVRSHADAIVQ
ncbi:response regulator transcription factor [Mucilaginibacter paludis]|uniref:Response regulator receiver protein n=1 Tax=Mucilaginibacter paludis DSM 18603 TaxID=714943 RepID=H1Y3M8_9SPHI|nr:response regulator [Mucilaginibacter paludis]EHQ30290.1 response regulator receiver protein [Mucilaginibacter paludis DSM 18603]